MQYKCPQCGERGKCLDDEWPDDCSCGYVFNDEAEEEIIDG
jgi:hypothetical protein